MTTGTTQVGGRVGVVGTGHRARLYVRAVAARPDSTIVSLCDVNSERMKHHQGLLKELGQPPAKEYASADFAKMLKDEKLDVLVVTTVDATHHEFIIPALKAGIRVLTEKPMTTDVAKCQEILKAVDETKGSLQVLFNYRYNPVHWKVEEVVASGAIGNVKSVHFEWLLDTVHGADYFRRWHRYKDKSGGLMVHKSSHHFDLVNFWINAKPQSVFGMGSLAFYGKENGKKSGWARDYYRASGSAEAADDPFAIHLEDQEDLKALYTDAEHVDNYHRDMNVFAEDITIEDDMSVLVKYDNGATMTYHLTAYSPWEGYRVMINGDKGRLELEVVESSHRNPTKKGGDASDFVHGEKALPNESRKSIKLHPLWETSRDVPFEEGTGGHAPDVGEQLTFTPGGGDDAMLDQIFGPRPGQKPSSTAVSRLSANQVDGALAMAVGLAANESFKTGQLVQIKELLGVQL